MNYNRLILGGRLVRDPELSFLPNQTPIVVFTIATSRKFKGGDGQQREDACFTDAKMFGKRAEVIDKYFKKGDPILCEGRLTLEKWENKDGQKRSKHVMMADNFEFVGGKSESEPAQQEQPATNQPPDDIPF